MQKINIFSGVKVEKVEPILEYVKRVATLALSNEVFGRTYFDVESNDTIYPVRLEIEDEQYKVIVNRDSIFNCRRNCEDRGERLSPMVAVNTLQEVVLQVFTQIVVNEYKDTAFFAQTVDLTTNHLFVGTFTGEAAFDKVTGRWLAQLLSKKIDVQYIYDTVAEYGIKY